MMIDDTNLEILKILQEKARIPNVEVSRLVNLAPSAVLERIRKLESQGIIEGYEVRLNPGRFGRSLVAFIEVRCSGADDLARIGEALSELEDIQEVHFIAGEDCFLVKSRTADMPGLDRLLRTRINAIAGVMSTRTMPVLNTCKETAQIPLRS